MVRRTELLNTIGVIAALLLQLTIGDSVCVYTKPKELGLFVAIFSNISYFSNIYALISTLTSSWWAVVYGTYGDTLRPIIGLGIAFVSLLIEQLLCTIVKRFDFVSPETPTWIPLFIVWIIPYTLTLIAVTVMIFQQQTEAKLAREGRGQQGLDLVDMEDRRENDPLNSFNARPIMRGQWRTPRTSVFS